MDTTLFTKAPIIAAVAVAAPCLAFYAKQPEIAAALLVILVLLIYYYRTPGSKYTVPDNIVMSPAQGTITILEDLADQTYISIYMSPIDNHTQVYPANCRILNQLVGKSIPLRNGRNVNKQGYLSDLNVNDKFVSRAKTNKSNDKAGNRNAAYDETVVHQLQLANGAMITLTQFADLPYSIMFDESNTKKDKIAMAGEYLGMNRGGSRVDILIPRGSTSKYMDLYYKQFWLNPTLQVGSKISFNDMLGYYK